MQIFMAAASLSLTSAHIHIIPRALALCVCSTVGKASPDDLETHVDHTYEDVRIISFKVPVTMPLTEHVFSA